MSDVLHFLASMWEGFKQIQIPGIGISMASLMLGVFVVRFAVMLISKIFGADRGLGGDRGSEKE